MSSCPTCDLDFRAGMAEECDVCADRAPLFVPPQDVRGNLDMSKADEVVVDALVAGHRFEGPLWIERWAAILKLRRVRPDLTSRQIAYQVGVTVRTVERVASREYQRVAKVPLREDVIQKVMAGKGFRRDRPTPHEMAEATRRMIREDRPDREIASVTGLTLAAVRGHKNRLKEASGARV